MPDAQLIRELESIFKIADELDPGYLSGIPVTVWRDGTIHTRPGAFEGNPHPVLTAAILCIAGHGMADSVEDSTVSVGRFRVTTDIEGFQHIIDILDDPLTPEETVGLPPKRVRNVRDTMPYDPTNSSYFILEHPTRGSVKEYEWEGNGYRVSWSRADSRADERTMRFLTLHEAIDIWRKIAGGEPSKIRVRRCSDWKAWCPKCGGWIGEFAQEYIFDHAELCPLRVALMKERGYR